MAQERIAIMTDSSCDLPQEIIDKMGIVMLPLRILYKEGEYRDRIEITAQQIYDRLAEEVPKSSLPMPEDIMRELDRLAEAGYTDVLYISISSGLSGTYNMVRNVAKEYTRLRLHVYDSLILSMGLGFQVLEAARTVAAGGGIEDALARIRLVHAQMEGMFVVKTLEYLRKGGRIGFVESAIGTLLRIMPVIGVGKTDGVYHTIVKARGRKQSVSALIDQFRQRYANKSIHVAVVHGDAEQEAYGILETVKSFARVVESMVVPVSPVLGVHTGPGLLGIIAYDA
nr:DegV family protein [Maliibacterium massiliense]